jgi:Phosphatidylinositol 3- and 4-kinase/Serine/threonine-protein kinase smg-1/FATC domain
MMQECAEFVERIESVSIGHKELLSLSERWAHAVVSLQQKQGSGGGNAMDRMLLTNQVGRVLHVLHENVPTDMYEYIAAAGSTSAKAKGMKKEKSAGSVTFRPKKCALACRWFRSLSYGVLRVLAPHYCRLVQRYLLVQLRSAKRRSDLRAWLRQQCMFLRASGSHLDDECVDELLQHDALMKLRFCADLSEQFVRLFAELMRGCAAHVAQRWLVSGLETRRRRAVECGAGLRGTDVDRCCLFDAAVLSTVPLGGSALDVLRRVAAALDDELCHDEVGAVACALASLLVRRTGDLLGNDAQLECSVRRCFASLGTRRAGAAAADRCRDSCAQWLRRYGRRDAALLSLIDAALPTSLGERRCSEALVDLCCTATLRFDVVGDDDDGSKRESVGALVARIVDCLRGDCPPWAEAARAHLQLRMRRIALPERRRDDRAIDNNDGDDPVAGDDEHGADYEIQSHGGHDYDRDRADDVAQLAQSCFERILDTLLRVRSAPLDAESVQRSFVALHDVYYCADIDDDGDGDNDNELPDVRRCVRRVIKCAAWQCVARRLVTATGKLPQHLFHGIEARLKAMSESGAADVHVLAFVNELEKAIECAARDSQASLARANVGDKARRFFVSQGTVCKNWFGRIRALLVDAAVRARSPADIVRHGGALLADERQSGSTLRATSLRVMGALAQLDDGDALDALAAMPCNASLSTWVNALQLQLNSNLESALQAYEALGAADALGTLARWHDICVRELDVAGVSAAPVPLFYVADVPAPAAAVTPLAAERFGGAWMRHLAFGPRQPRDWARALGSDRQRRRRLLLLATRARKAGNVKLAAAVLDQCGTLANIGGGGGDDLKWQLRMERTKLLFDSKSNAKLLLDSQKSGGDESNAMLCFTTKHWELDSAATSERQLRATDSLLHEQLGATLKQRALPSAKLWFRWAEFGSRSAQQVRDDGDDDDDDEDKARRFDMLADAYATSLRAGGLDSVRRTTATLRLLHLMVTGNSERATHAVGADMSVSSGGAWHELVPQLLAWLSHSDEAVRSAIERRLASVASLRLVVYPLLAALEETRRSHRAVTRTHLKSLLAALRAEHGDDVIGAVELTVAELRRIARLWCDSWRHVVERLLKSDTRNNARPSPASSSSAAAMATMDTVRAMRALEHLHASTLARDAETPDERRFVSKYGARIDDMMARLRASDKSIDAAALMRAELTALRDALPLAKGVRVHSLKSISPALVRAAAANVAVPLPDRDGDGALLLRFGARVTTLPTKTRPKRLTIVDGRGRSHTFLLKAGEDLRLDERVMQLLRFANGSLAAAGESLRAEAYAIVPLSSRAGLIRWVHGCTQLYTLYKAHCAAQRPAPLNPATLYAHELERAHGDRRVAFDALRASTPSTLLSSAMWRRSASSQAWHAARRSFARSLATMSMLGHVVGLGDRHLDNILVDLRSGRVVHIDYNVCFEKGAQLAVPETVPFRLTHNLVDALPFATTRGSFERAARATLGMLSQRRSALLLLLNTFLIDPLHQWTSSSSSASSSSAASQSILMPFKSGAACPRMNSRALHVLTRVSQKLAIANDRIAPTADRLIEEAQSTENLCQLWKGWLAWV